jgi:hypothetical protein
MQWTWPAWRLMETRRASFTEVTEKMSIIDILKLHDAILAVADADYRAQKAAEKQNK